MRHSQEAHEPGLSENATGSAILHSEQSLKGSFASPFVVSIQGAPYLLQKQISAALSKALCMGVPSSTRHTTLASTSEKVNILKI